MRISGVSSDVCSSDLNTMNYNQDAAQTARSHKPLLIVIFSIAAIVAAIFWWLSRGYESTDDASIQSDITMVAARVSGTVINVKVRSEEHTSELQSLMRISYAVFCLKKKKNNKKNTFNRDTHTTEKRIKENNKRD